MQRGTEIGLLLFLAFNLTLFSPSISHPTATNFCGKIPIQAPLSLQNSVESTLHRLILCKSEKLYFRTSIGLFPISSIDYRTKTLTISHSSCSSTLNFVSPSLLSAGFPSPPQPNSLLLFNCSRPTELTKPLLSVLKNCTHSYNCRAPSEAQEQEKGYSSCFFVDDSEKLKLGFHPKDWNCSHYNRVYKDSSLEEGFEMGTRISFEIPNHVPKICEECKRPHGNCGVGLRCVCHANECKDKVFSGCACIDPAGNILFSLLSLVLMMASFISS
ncbi:hypothetical protein NE237_002772 [Protea cynaroides]|uniref:Wall-associated receptor kinase C-terminal domain-containing protein n=1 Tax=Protea cynaroides TaxID=273540 RepID=A0A9Q0QRZ0_9MAGN|nr:hypothetical protein NE237_002772 [Protea cynaroides]